MALRHVVLFGFAEKIGPDAQAEVGRRFAALAQSVPGVEAFERGENSSPEGLNKGLTHAFLLTFSSDAARDAYLIHPEHQAFAQWVTSLVASVTVVDYWAKDEPTRAPGAGQGA